jgi:MYXO-CTERM domain-containing protein
MLHASSLRRTTTRLVLGTSAVVAATVALPGAAQAHVTVQPGTAEGGSFSVVAFRVPNERDDASTTKLRVVLPADHPIGSVQTTPVPGWSVSTSTRHLSQPIEMFGQKLDTVVSQVTWTATNGGIKSGQFQDFELSLGVLPASGQLQFKALQTYSSGEQVNWNEVSTDPSVEPEHPAPLLSLAPAASEQDSGTPSAGSGTGAAAGGQADESASGTATENGSDSTLSIAMSGGALVLSALAAILAWRRGRPAREDTQARPTRVHEDANV